MYKDIITYELSENTSLEHLITISKRVVEEWMKKQTGFVKWEIHTNSDGTFTDVVYWESKEDAQTAEKDMANIPNAMEWFSCYKEGSMSTKNLSKIVEF